MDLSGNCLKKIPDEPLIKSLEGLYIDGNFLEGHVAIEGFPNLKNLVLASNKIETFGITGLADRLATVSGLVTTRLGRPACVGDAVMVGNVRLIVTAVAGRRVQRLRLTLLGAPAPQGEAGRV